MPASWFGTSWGAPFCQSTPQVSVPVGEPCLHCAERIEHGDSGVLTPYLDSLSPGGGVITVGTAVYHVECWVRSVLGSVGHQLGVCSCFTTGVDAYEDPPGMSLREAAKAACELANQRAVAPRDPS